MNQLKTAQGFRRQEIKDNDVLNKSVEIENRAGKGTTAGGSGDGLDGFLNKSFDTTQDRNGNIRLRMNSLYNSNLYNDKRINNN